MAGPRVVAIVQARMTSTRLPGKVLADLGGRPVLAFMLERVKRARTLDGLVVATTVNATDDPVARAAAAAGVEVFRGDEKDVLSRFVGAGEAARADVVVRLTADCPFTDPALVDLAVARFLEADLDYLANAVDRTYPDGLDVEVLRFEALRRAARETREPYDREHVTPYLYRPGGGFRVGSFRHDSDLSALRWTIDTAEDLAVARRLIAGLPDDAGWLDILAAQQRAAAIAIRPAQPRDATLLFEWANDPALASVNLATAGPIPWETHERWFAARLDDPNSRIWIAEDAGGRPLGQVRLQEKDGWAEVSVYVAPESRRGGVALRLLRHAQASCVEAWPGRLLRARVRRDNEKSRRLFAEAGYANAEDRADHLVMTREAGPIS